MDGERSQCKASEASARLAQASASWCKGKGGKYLVQEYTLVFSDMDGTFVTSKKEITSTNIEALDYLYARGISFVPASGRPLLAMPQELLVHSAVRYLICCNGAQIFDLYPQGRGSQGRDLQGRGLQAMHSQSAHPQTTDSQAALGQSSPQNLCSPARSQNSPLQTLRPKKLLDLPIAHDLVYELYQKIKTYPVTFDLFANDCVYTEASRFYIIDESELDAHSKALVKRTRICFDQPFEDFLSQLASVTRITLVGRTHDALEPMRDIVRSYPKLRFTSSLSCNIEISDVRAHKGQALTWLCQHVGVPCKKTLAFGDADNDITMLAAAGRGVAMQNAMPSCSKVADDVAVSCDESGVGRYIFDHC